MKTLNKQWLLPGLSLALFLALVWLLITENPYIWPIRNTLQYRLITALGEPLAQPAPAASGTLQGQVRDMQGQPVAGARVLVAERNGTTYSTRTDATGHYTLTAVPARVYRPVAGAPGYQSVQFGENWFGQVFIGPNKTTTANVTLPPKTERTITPGRQFSLGQPTTLSCGRPLESSATRQQIHFISDGQPNQAAFYYRPATTAGPWPILLAIYPGPADSWECASLPLSAAGYAVVATGPAYSFDLEKDVDELERILAFARAGEFPEGDGSNLAILGGSYSSLHVQRLLQRGQAVQAALLLGPPTDLFDMRRRLENGSYIPPFGLDQALIALGLPDRVPLRYWRYSGAYHVHRNFPPLAILHSRTDEVVPYQQSELLVEHLQQVGASYEAHFFDGASHYLLAEDGDQDTVRIYDLTLDFLARQLK